MDKHKQQEDGLSEFTEAVRFECAQAGCRACLEHLMTRHKRLVPFVTRRQALGELSYDEAIQAGRIGLWQAIVGYDPDRGYAFSTYAYPAITRRIWLAVKRAERSSSRAAAVELPLREAAADPALVCEAGQVVSALYELVARLPQRLRMVIIARYGLAGKPPATYAEIGLLLGRSWERARQLHLEALVWLRHPAHSQQLRAMLGRHSPSDYAFADDLAQRWLRRKRGGRYGST